MPSLINAGIPEKFRGQETIAAKVLDESESRIWHWLNEHRHDVIYEKKILFWTIKIKVHDLFNLFDTLFRNTKPAKLNV